MRFTYTLLLILLSCTMVQAQQKLLYKLRWSIKTDTLLTDSIAYSYSNGRGSNYNADSINFDTEIHYRMLSGALMLFDTTTRTYNTNNDLLTESFYMGNGQVLQNNRIDSFEYDTTGALIYHINYQRRMSFMDPYMHYKYFYDTLGLLIREEHYAWKNSSGGVGPSDTSVISQIHHYLYDTSQNLILDSILSYRTPYNKLMPAVNYVYKYDALNRKIEESKYNISLLGAVQLENRTFYYYDANGILIGDSIQTLIPPYTGVRTQKENRYTYKLNGLLDSIIYQETLNGKVDVEQIHFFEYNSFDYISKFWYLNYSYGSQSNGRTDYYYTLGTSPISVFNIEGHLNEDDLIAYPVPSSNFINLKWETAKPTTINARLVNLHGQVVKQWSDKVDGIYSKSVHVGELPAGNYYIILEAGGNIMRKQISIQR